MTRIKQRLLEIEMKIIKKLDESLDGVELSQSDKKLIATALSESRKLAIVQ